MAGSKEQDDRHTPETSEDLDLTYLETVEVSNTETLEAPQRGAYANRCIKNLYIRYSVHLESFVPEILHFRGLELLDISGCGISSLAPNIAHFLPSLNILYLTDCGFTTFPDLSSFPNLVCASLCGNSMSTIPEDFLPVSLVHLMLTNNDIDRLPTA